MATLPRVHSYKKLKVAAKPMSGYNLLLPPIEQLYWRCVGSFPRYTVHDAEAGVLGGGGVPCRDAVVNSEWTPPMREETASGYMHGRIYSFGGLGSSTGRLSSVVTFDCVMCEALDCPRRERAAMSPPPPPQGHLGAGHYLSHVRTAAAAPKQPHRDCN